MILQRKICKARFCKVYFSWNKLICGNWLFLFLRNIDALIFQVAKVSIPIPFFSSLFFMRFSFPAPNLTVTTRFLGIGRDKVWWLIWVELYFICCILTFEPAKNAIPRWYTGRRGHILMAVMRGNRVGGNWLMKWDEVKKNSHGTLIDWCTGREWPVNCMTVISAWWRSNMRFQKSSKRLSGRGTIIKLSQDRSQSCS